MYAVHFIIVAAGRGCSDGGDFALFCPHFAAAVEGKTVKVGSAFRLSPA